ncbi:hypothetical protein APY03_5916 [Variovorax sp. WDL1]|nr:hypothetical protein APY03_5916 [Variovorax sp. WDL1]
MHQGLDHQRQALRCHVGSARRGWRDIDVRPLFHPGHHTRSTAGSVALAQGLGRQPCVE